MMRAHQKKHERFLHWQGALVRSIAAVLAASSLSLAQQNPPVLQITSPVDGSVVNPGQAISVSVTSPANLSFSQIFVIADGTIDASTIANSVPAQFSMPVTKDAEIGKHFLTAWGTTGAGQVLGSAPITVDVERPDAPTKLKADPLNVTFRSQGDREPLRILGTFSDGSLLDLTRSSNLAYASSNTSVATVDKNGIVTAVAKGGASITATYTQGTQSVRVSVPVTVPPPVLAPSPTSLNFNSQDVGTSSPAQTLSVTNVSNNQGLKVGPVSAVGDFFETDNCATSSPMAVGGMCTINVTFRPTAAGSRTGTVNVADSMDIVPQAIPLSGTGIGQPTTATSMASSANPSVFGQSVTLMATVTPSSGSGTPSGTVTFNDGSTALGTQPLTNGQATFTTSSFSVGSHSITAAYSGDSTFQASTGALSQTVNPASTTTTVSSSANPSIFNGSVTFTGTVNVVTPGAGVPTGSITFQEGTTALGIVSLNSSGSASFTTSSLAVAAHHITAAYSGDGNFAGSTGNLTENVSYSICVLYDQTRSVNSGATFPIKLYLCDSSGNDVSSSSVVLHATQVTNVSGFSGTVETPGNANPDNDFRFDSTLGPAGGYIFNLGTASLASGTYSLQFTAGTDPTPHAVNFGVK